MSIIAGDCIAVMGAMEPDTIDAICTDPPYGIGFMGKDWDSVAALRSRPPSADRAAAQGRDPYPRTGKGPKAVAFDGRAWQEWSYSWAVEAFRVAKPGAHLLAFGGTRTYHRLACAIEDAGWEVRDCLVWAYASGFPKSLDVSKAIDKAAGAEREVKLWLAPMKSGAVATDGGMTGNKQCPLCGKWLRSPDPCLCPKDNGPATPEAARWQGWGTALKPAWEPIILARKPLRGTVAANVQKYGTGALNIGGCRIGTGEGGDRVGEATASTRYGGAAAGRWPANIVLTDPIFDGDTPGVVGGGETRAAGEYAKGSRGFDPDTGRRGVAAFGVDGLTSQTYGDSGTYSRFFLIPKADRSDREPVTHNGDERANKHPTVKPTDLMRHLVRLVTPPGGIVLDPFLGSGTTALAAEMEGFRWVGIEREEEYVRIAEARLNGVQRGLAL